MSGWLLLPYTSLHKSLCSLFLVDYCSQMWRILFNICSRTVLYILPSKLISDTFESLVFFFEGRYKELLIEGYIFLCMVTHMGLPLMSLSGISLKRFMNLKRHYARWFCLPVSFKSLVCSLLLICLLQPWQCAESALKSVIGDLSNTYFVGNAPMGHIVMQPKENDAGSSSLKVQD